MTMPKSPTRWKRLPVDFLFDHRDDYMKDKTYWVAVNLESLVDSLPDEMKQTGERIVRNYIDDYEKFTLSIARMVAYREALCKRLTENGISYADLHEYYYPVIPGDG